MHDVSDDPRAPAANRGFALLFRRFGRNRLHDVSDLRQIAWVAACKVYDQGHRDETLIAFTVRSSIWEWNRTYGTRSKWVGSTIFEDIGEYSCDEPIETTSYERPKMLACLPESRARALELFYVAGMDQRGVADVMGIKLASAKAIISMAKRTFRKIYAKESTHQP
jgi:DNA-directed RNA polymerase specialized sigma24 family protein